MRITVAITAKNEELAIRACLTSVLASIRFAENSGHEYHPVVVLNDSTDCTASLVPEDVATMNTVGGLVEAQRAVAHHLPFVIFCDADILLSENAVAELTRAMLDDPALRVCYPKKIPAQPHSSSLLAKALYTYNANDGFETRRSHFNGKCFAIRGWDIPKVTSDLSDPFLNLQAGVRADDIYLSKSILTAGGAILEIPAATITYQAPETLHGMYLYYRRMRMELTRVALLFPDLKWPACPPRGTDWARLSAASLREKFHWLVFQIAFRLCKIRYHFDRIRYTHFSKTPCPFWPPVTETKILRESSAGIRPELRPSKSGTSSSQAGHSGSGSPTLDTRKS